MEPSSAPWRVLDEAGSAAAPTTDASAATTTSTPAAGSADRDPRRRWLALGGAVFSVAVAVAAVAAAARPDTPVTASGEPDPAAVVNLPRASGEAAGSPAGSVLVVEVGGAVRAPGLYRLAAGSRVGDAIAAAGGYGPRVDAVAADLALNLARRLEDGDEIHVPSRDEAAQAAQATTAAAQPPGAAAGGLVNLNSASAEALDALPGVGPATAAKIIAARTEQPFRSLDELVSRKVLGQAVLAKIRARVTVGG